MDDDARKLALLQQLAQPDSESEDEGESDDEDEGEGESDDEDEGEG